MRVTRTIREYIEKSVKEKVYKKYEVEKEAAEAEQKTLNDFWDKLGEEIENIAKERVEKFIAENDFVELTEARYTSSCFTSYYSGRVSIKDKIYSNSKHNWRRRADAETKKKVDEIIITLELGGSKADLDKMLSEI